MKNKMPVPEFRRGFTILETLFAAGILLIVIMAVLNIFPSASLASKRADQQMTADALVQGKLEQIRDLYDTVDNDLVEQNISGTVYRVDMVVSTPPASLGTEAVKQVVVTVSWDDPGPVARRRNVAGQLYVTRVSR